MRINICHLKKKLLNDLKIAQSLVKYFAIYLSSLAHVNQMNASQYDVSNQRHPIKQKFFEDSNHIFLLVLKIFSIVSKAKFLCAFISN